MLRVLLAGCLLLVPGFVAAAPDGPVSFMVAGDGQAQTAVVVAEGCSPAVRESAETLATLLSRITGGSFEVREGEGASGIAVGLVAAFPDLELAGALEVPGAAGREQYGLRSHEKGIWLVGATPLAVEHAVWDLLHRVGFRQYFPGEAWEIVPERPTLAVAVDALERPDYLSRRIWYGYGPWDYAREPYARWCRRNRMVSGFELNTGHAYEGIISRNQAAFDAHPEYLGLVNAKRGSTKLCISNPDLRRLVVADALARIESHPETDSVSVDPSDGGGWCECEPCAAIGSVSDRALTLANAVSVALEERDDDKYVAMYAYNQHAPPPSIRARSRVIVNVATAFIKGGYTLEAIITGWKAAGIRQFGIREYYSVNTWDRDLPGAARGSRLDYLVRTIPEFHGKGARFLTAESSDNWGPNGLGYYLAARMMWDVDEADRREAIVDDFLERCFGAAREPMASFYREFLHAPERPRMSDTLVGRMYRTLGRALELAGDPAVVRRIDHLVLYTRYVELYRAYGAASASEMTERAPPVEMPDERDPLEAAFEEDGLMGAGDDGPPEHVMVKVSQRQLAFEALIRHAYRMRETEMVHTKALYRDLPARDKSVTPLGGAGWQTPEAENPLKTSRPFTREELDTLVAEGIERNDVVEFEPVTFSGSLVPLPAAVASDAEPLGGPAATGRGRRTFMIWVEAAPRTIRLEVTGGLIAHYRDRGDVQIDLHRPGSDEPIGHAEVPPDGQTYPVELATDQAGLHRLTVSDGHDKTRVAWPEGLAVTRPAAQASSGYFWVPPGTDVVAGYLGRGGKRSVMRDSRGRTVLNLTGLGNGYFTVAVPEAEAGRAWSFHEARGLELMTVPPWAARRPGDLLVPRESVE